MPVLANILNSDLSRGFTTVQDVSPILYQNMTKMVDGWKSKFLSSLIIKLRGM